MVAPIQRSFLFSMADRYGSLIIQLGAIAALSRLLTPHEFGIYSIVIAISALANTFREFGGANYVIQKPIISEQCVRSAFTVSLLMSGLLAAVLLSLRDAAVLFFSEEGLRQGISVASINFLLLPFSVILSALLRREMAFDALAVCNLSANVASAITSVAFALIGLGFIAPIWGSVAGNVALVCLLLLQRPQLGIFRLSFRSWGDVVAFGAYSSATVVVNVLYTWSPQIILGRVLGMTAAGLYTRAGNVIQLFDKLVLDVINPVVMPAFAGQARAGADLKRLYLQSVELITALHWPFFMFVTVMADPIVNMIFGPQWTAAVPLVRLLAFASLSLFAACLTYPVLVSTGRVRDTLTISLISVPPSLLAMFVASFFGIQAVAAAALFALPLQACVALNFICRRIGVSLFDLAQALWRSAVTAGCTGLGLVLVLWLNGFSLTFSLPGFLAAGIAAGASWFCGLVLAKHPLLRHLRAFADARPARAPASPSGLLPHGVPPPPPRPEPQRPGAA